MVGGAVHCSLKAGVSHVITTVYDTLASIHNTFIEICGLDQSLSVLPNKRGKNTCYSSKQLDIGIGGVTVISFTTTDKPYVADIPGQQGQRAIGTDTDYEMFKYTGKTDTG